MKVALVYDRVNKWGGAERVLLALHEIFKDAPLYTSVYLKKSARWAKLFSVKTSFLEKIPFAKSSHEYFATLMPIAFEQFSFDEYDVVISVTSESAKGIITKPDTVHICYCLTPTRYLWSGYDEYFHNPLLKLFSRPAVSYLRKWDSIASVRPDIMIAISKEVQRRIYTYYKRKADIIYPPLPFDDDLKPLSIKKGAYFLVVSRLVPYKRIDLAIKACNILSLPLVIVGVGSEKKKLEKIAGTTIRFVGSLTDEELVEYYKGCKGLIFPGREDFGLTVLEAQRYGKPVIAFKRGGALETIRDGKTGLFFYPQTVKALTHALIQFRKKRFSPESCKEQAMIFSKKHFQENILRLVKEIENKR